MKPLNNLSLEMIDYQYFDSNYGSQKYRKKVQRLTARFESNREILADAAILEAEDQRAAIKAYQKMRAERKYNSNRDALLYHN
jgi:hypothetical protein